MSHVHRRVAVTKLQTPNTEGISFLKGKRKKTKTAVSRPYSYLKMKGSPKRSEALTAYLSRRFHDFACPPSFTMVLDYWYVQSKSNSILAGQEHLLSGIFDAEIRPVCFEQFVYSAAKV